MVAVITVDSSLYARTIPSFVSNPEIIKLQSLKFCYYRNFKTCNCFSQFYNDILFFMFNLKSTVTICTGTHVIIKTQQLMQHRTVVSLCVLQSSNGEGS